MVIKRAFVGIVAFAHTAGWAIFLAEVLFVMGKLLINGSSAMAVTFIRCYVGTGSMLANAGLHSRHGCESENGKDLHEEVVGPADARRNPTRW